MITLSLYILHDVGDTAPKPFILYETDDSKSTFHKLPRTSGLISFLLDIEFWSKMPIITRRFSFLWLQSNFETRTQCIINHRGIERLRSSEENQQKLIGSKQKCDNYEPSQLEKR